MEMWKSIGPDELRVYDEWSQKGLPFIPLASALKLYELFLNGYSVNEIYRINGGKIELGAIVDARIRFKWDERKEKQLEGLYSNIDQKIIKAKNEALVYLTDSLAAAHKLMGDKVKLFLQEGDISLIQGMDLDKFKTYKELLQMLQTLTANNGKNVPQREVLIGGEVMHTHRVEKMNGADATNMLKELEDKVIE